MCTLRDAVQHNLTLVCVDKQSMRIVMTRDREFQTFREGDWAEWNPSFEAFPTWPINPWVVNIRGTWCCSLVGFIRAIWIEANSVLIIIIISNLHPLVTVIDQIPYTNHKSQNYERFWQIFSGNQNKIALVFCFSAGFFSSQDIWLQKFKHKIS